MIPNRIAQHEEILSSHALADSAHLQKALEAVPGVQSVRVETHEGRITIEHAGAEKQKLVAAVKAAGYDATLVPDNAEVMAPPLPRMDSTTDAQSSAG